jgi:hypothetical protein
MYQKAAQRLVSLEREREESALKLQQAQARWRVGTTEAAEIDIEASVAHLTQLPAAAPTTSPKGKAARAAAAQSAEPAPSIEAATLRVTGTMAEHRIELRAGSKVQPPAWTETLQPDIAAQPGTTLHLLTRGGLFTHQGQPLAGWRGSVQRLEMGGAGAASSTTAAGGLPAWLVLQDIDVQAQWAGGPAALERVAQRLQPVSLVALLATLVLLFGFQGPAILAQPVVIALLAVPILIQTWFNAGLAYVLARRFNVAHCVAGPAALIGASNFFELAVAAAISLFGITSGAALATVVGVLIEVPVMLSVVAIVRRTAPWYERGLSEKAGPA